MRAFVLMLITVASLLTACESGIGTPTAPPQTGAPTSPAVPTSAGTIAAAGSGLALTAQPLDTIIRLSWTPVAGARGYNVNRDGQTAPLNATPIADPTFDDIGLTNGRTYSYTVTALDTAGNPVTRSAVVSVAPRSK